MKGALDRDGRIFFKSNIKINGRMSPFISINRWFEVLFSFSMGNTIKIIVKMSLDDSIKYDETYFKK